MQHSVGRRLSRRAKGAVLTLIAGAGLVLTGVAQADTTNPATIWVPANSTRTAQGTFDDPLVHVDPALSCPTQQADPAQTVPNCVHTVAVVQLGPGGQADMVVRVTADENEASPDVTVKDPDTGIVLAQGLGGTCADTPSTGCAETPPFRVAAGQRLDIITSPFLFFCPPGLPDPTDPLKTCPPVPFTVRATLGAQIGGGGGGVGGVDPPVFVSDATVVEGDSGARDAVFTVTMGDTSLVPVTVNYRAADAEVPSAAAGSDYLPVLGTVVFAPGETRKTFTVPILGDLAREGNETFNVILSLPQPVRVGTIGDGIGVARITNDDWGRQMTGSGRLLVGNGSFALRLYEGWWYWYVRYYAGTSFNFWATSMTSRTWDDLTHSVKITGAGWNAGHSVTYTLEVVDNGAALDTVVLTLSDGSTASGTFASGGVTFRG